jgi:hypothetical protein
MDIGCLYIITVVYICMNIYIYIYIYIYNLYRIIIVYNTNAHISESITQYLNAD